jgi:hypothetical protein
MNAYSGVILEILAEQIAARLTTSHFGFSVGNVCRIFSPQGSKQSVRGWMSD